jgi:ketosteroid isomerase-like protein
MRTQRRALLFLTALFLSYNPLSAQLMPGGRTVDVGRLRGDFYNQMVDKVNEVMDSWQGAWRKTGEERVPDHYFREATLLQPGGLPLRGREAIEAFSDAALPLTSAIRTGMQDLEACEGFAYLSGYYAADPRSGGLGSNSGRHFTVIEEEGGDWLIRAQLFLPDSGTVDFPEVITPELLEPLTNDKVRSGRRGASRFAAYGDAEFVLMAFRDAWHRGDVPDAASFFSEDAWVRLPHETGNMMGHLTLSERLQEGMDLYGDILTVELDFDRRDRLSFTFGRFHAEGVDRPDRPGHYFMLLKNEGYGWKIRSLAFF